MIPYFTKPGLWNLCYLRRFSKQSKKAPSNLHNVTFWLCGRHKGSRAPHWHCMPWGHPPHPWWITWDLIGTFGIGFCQNWGQFGTFGGVFKACPPASLEQFIDHGFGGSHANWSCYKSGAHPTWKHMIFWWFSKHAFGTCVHLLMKITNLVG